LKQFLTHCASFLPTGMSGNRSDSGRLGIPQDRIAKRLGMDQKTIHYHLGKMPVLANSLNTDIITNILKKRPSPFLIKQLASIPKAQQFISTITVSKIVYGSMKSGRPDYHLKNLEEILIPAVNIAPFDTSAAYICGNLQARLEKQGMPLALADLEITANALARVLHLYQETSTSPE